MTKHKRMSKKQPIATVKHNKRGIYCRAKYGRICKKPKCECKSTITLPEQGKMMEHKNQNEISGNDDPNNNYLKAMYLQKTTTFEEFKHQQNKDVESLVHIHEITKENSMSITSNNMNILSSVFSQSREILFDFFKSLKMIM